MNCKKHAMLLQLGFLISLLGNVCASQTPFQVSNPKQQQWPREEADRIYLSAARHLAAEFNRPQPPAAVFTLALGANENAVDMNTRELRLRKWNKYLYAEGVLRLIFDQMLSTESKMKLARWAVAESDATVNVHNTETAETENPRPASSNPVTNGMFTNVPSGHESQEPGERPVDPSASLMFPLCFP